MKRSLSPAAAVLAGVLAVGSPAVAAGLAGTEPGGDIPLYAAAFAALDQGAPALARATVAAAPAPSLAWVIDGVALASDGSFRAIAAFLAEHPRWPRAAGLRKRAEAAIPEDAADAEVAAWFAAHPPTTALAVARCEEAAARARGAAAAQSCILAPWPEMRLSDAETAAFLAAAPILGEAERARRLAALLDAGRTGEARALLTGMPPEWTLLADARLALAARAPDAAARLEAVPQRLRGDAGLALERARWLRRGGQLDRAAEALRALPAGGDTAKAWGERRAVATALLERGDAKGALRLVQAHGLPDGLSRWQAEMMAGWIALRRLADHREAAARFAEAARIARSPVGVAAGAYWRARAAEAGGDAAAATARLVEAAAHPGTYYGQLAADALAARGHAVRTTAEAPPAALGPEAAPLARAATLLAALGRNGMRDEMLGALAEAVRTPGEFAAAGQLAAEIAGPTAAVRMAEAAAAAGIDAGAWGHPLPSWVPESPRRAAVLAVARTESRFDQRARSPAGAVGALQLTEPTAREAARLAGQPYDAGRLAGDEGYNAALGTAQLTMLLARYDGSLPLAAAAYNAGPARVEEWLRRHGDPRRGADLVDWVEAIPYPETRNYVQRVVEAERSYARRLAEPRP